MVQFDTMDKDNINYINNRINCFNNYLCDSDTEPESELESEPHIECDLEINDESEMHNIINSSMCYFTRDSRPTNLNLACYHCDKKCHSEHITTFIDRYVKGVLIYDVPICPHCHIDAIIDTNKLKQNKIEETKLLYQMKKIKCK